MNLTRANEKPLESHGQAEPTPGGVSDWQSDRLASALSKMDQLFTAAFEEQLKHLPGSAEGLVQVKATISDIAQAAKNDPASRRGLLEASEEFVTKIESVNLPNVIKEGKDVEMLGATLALLANTQFAQSTFYGITQDACHSENKLEQMCESAHALVKAGYVGEKELAGVQVAVADSQSVKARAAEAFANISRSNGMHGARSAQEPASSYFLDDLAKYVGTQHNKPTIHINVDESQTMGGSRTDATGRVFSHELGHWLTRDKSPEILAAGVAGVKALGGADAAHVEQFFKPSDLDAKALSMIASANGGILTQELRQEDGALSISWLKAVKEMQGDIMAVATENALNGKESALSKAQQIANYRDTERLGDLAANTTLMQGSNANPRFSEEHFTSEVVREFADRVRSGDLDKVSTPAQLDKLMGESIVKGVISEYTQVRGAELNVHHIENGKVVPGPPEGVDIKSVLVAEMAKNMSHQHGHPTVLLTQAQAQDLPAGATAVGLTVPGHSPSDAPTKFFLSTAAPPGMSMPSMGRGTEDVAGYSVSESMAPFARSVAERGGMSLERPSLEAEKTPAFDNALDRSLGDRIGGKIASQESSPQKSAAPAPAAEMSM